MNKMLSIMVQLSLIVGSMIWLSLFMNACTSFNKPATIDEAPIHKRALTKESNRILASAAVVGDQEARQIFGIDLSKKNIQAVWLEIENHTDRPLILLPTALDPDYFTPLEVAYAYHKSFATDANAALDEHLLNLNFPIRNLIEPGSHVSGYIFTNWSKRMKVIGVDLVGHNFSRNFTFFTSSPDSTLEQAVINRIETMFSAAELQIVGSESELRQALEQLPCCVSKENGELSAEPLNVVIIGAFDDWTTAFVRRGYQYQVLNPRYAFGRTQDISGRKLSRGYIKAQAHAIRLWQTPIRYDGKPVWVGQTGTRLGGRFADKAPAEITLPLNPQVDEARDDLNQDMAYSQALIRIGYVKGSGRSPSTTAEEFSKNVHYITDGLRVVLVFGDRPTSLNEIDFFTWERLADYR